MAGRQLHSVIRGKGGGDGGGTSRSYREREGEAIIHSVCSKDWAAGHPQSGS